MEYLAYEYFCCKLHINCNLCSVLIPVNPYTLFSTWNGRLCVLCVNCDAKHALYSVLPLVVCVVPPSASSRTLQWDPDPSVLQLQADSELGYFLLPFLFNHTSLFTFICFFTFAFFHLMLGSSVSASPLLPDLLFIYFCITHTCPSRSHCFPFYVWWN